MPKFEYLVLGYIPAGAAYLADNILNPHGADGWELVGIFEHLIIFKRPKQ